MRNFNIFLYVILLCQSLHAAEGVLEINQACALNGGCFAGDTAGFPVEISTPGSYRLTGNLDLSSFPDSQAILIASPYVTLDLNGFEIAGSATCTGSGPTLDCGTPGTGTGIRVDFDANGTVIRNGTIRNMSASGVSANDTRVILEGLRAYHNARDGFNGGRSSIARKCIAEENADVGFEFGLASVIEGSIALGNGSHGFQVDNFKGVVTNSTSRGNGGRGYELGHSSKFRDNISDLNSEPDRCGGGLCTSRKRYYRTTTTHDGANALNACTDGFHMATLHEILDYSNWQYDTVLGLTRDDSGSGPPTGIFGAWIRTGSASDTVGNCLSWTSNSVSHDGVIATPEPVGGLTNADSNRFPWRVEIDNVFTSCSAQNQVWCAED